MLKIPMRHIDKVDIKGGTYREQSDGSIAIEGDKGEIDMQITSVNVPKKDAEGILNRLNSYRKSRSGNGGSVEGQVPS